jgi:hypothetical protein
MTFKKTDSVYRLLRWCLQRLDDFWGSSLEIRLRVDGKMNLCPMVRCMVLWAPLTLFLRALILAFCVVVVVVLPFTLFGILGVAKAAVFVVIAVAILVGLFFSGKWVRGHVDPEDIIDSRPVQAVGSFWTLSRGWYQAFHDKVCPIVVFEDGEEEGDD